MSRIGKMPVKIPKGVTVEVEEGRILVSNGKVRLRSPLPKGISARLDSDQPHYNLSFIP